MSSRESEKKDFMKKITVLIDTREQKNAHIVKALDAYGVMHESRKLDFGDYSFMADGRDFSGSCVIERKANVNEVYGNLSADRERIEKELDTISRNARQCILLLENCEGWDALKAASILQEEADRTGRKVLNIGATCYGTLQAWRCGNRYRFGVEFVPDPRQSAARMLELFFWYWHNYKKQTAARRT